MMNQCILKIREHSISRLHSSMEKENYKQGYATPRSKEANLTLARKTFCHSSWFTQLVIVISKTSNSINVQNQQINTKKQRKLRVIQVCKQSQYIEEHKLTPSNSAFPASGTSLISLTFNAYNHKKRNNELSLKQSIKMIQKQKYIYLKSLHRSMMWFLQIAQLSTTISENQTKAN